MATVRETLQAELAAAKAKVAELEAHLVSGESWLEHDWETFKANAEKWWNLVKSRL